MIVIILVNWNGYSDTIECLESLLRMQNSDFVVLVVDNGSTDESVAEIEAWAAHPPVEKPVGAPWARLPDRRVVEPRLVRGGPDTTIDGLTPGTIVLVETKENLGFAGANNVGMRIARKNLQVTHFWLLNNDTVVAPDCLTRQLDWARKKPDAGLIGSCVLYYDQPEIVLTVGCVYYPWLTKCEYLGLRQTRETLPTIETIEKKITFVQGASIFLSIQVFDAIGYMSEDYFLYYEEPDWAFRLPKNYHQTTALDALVYHKEGGTLGSSSRSRPSDVSLYYSHANIFRYTWRWHRLWILVAYARVARNALIYLGRRDWAAVKIILKGMIDGHSPSGKLLKPVSSGGKTTFEDR